MPPPGALNIFPAANATNILRLLYISWRLMPPLNIFPAANAAFSGAIRPKRRRVNYEVNYGFSHLDGHRRAYNKTSTGSSLEVSCQFDVLETSWRDISIIASILMRFLAKVLCEG